MPSKRLIVSYVLDWVVIIILAAAGGGLNFTKPSTRPFSLLDLSISYPFKRASISVTTLALVALVAPAVIIVLISAILVPGTRARTSSTRSQTIRRKIWELHIGLIGLALSVALAFFVTQGLKNIFAKPRPHFIELCKPDLSNIASHGVGGYGQDISVRWTLVDSSICTETDSQKLADGYRSFPSGHCSFSWSGLLYLSLFLCSKFAIAIPYLSTQPTGHGGQIETARPVDVELLPLPATSSGERSKSPNWPATHPGAPSESVPLYNQAATPPNYGLILVLIPVAVATYIASTRYHEYWHFGFDVLSGSLIGILSAWFSFRWYHLPISRGQGWAWGPRSRERAFGIGVGVGNYVGPEGWDSGRSSTRRVVEAAAA